MLKLALFARRVRRTPQTMGGAPRRRKGVLMSANQQDFDQKSGFREPSVVARTPSSEAFEAGRTRGIKDGADWARYRAVTADLRRMCDHPDQGPIAPTELLDLLQGYRHDPRCLAAASGHGSEPYQNGYGVGFQRGACSVWSSLCELAAELERLF